MRALASDCGSKCWPEVAGRILSLQERTATINTKIDKLKGAVKVGLRDDQTLSSTLRALQSIGISATGSAEQRSFSVSR